MIDIDVSIALRQPGTTFTFGYSGIPGMLEFEIATPLVLSAEYSSTDARSVRVKGEFSVVVEEVCTRCLRGVEYGIVHEFDELYVPPQYADDDNYTFTGQTVSLDKMVYDAVLLAIPQQILCKQDCAGLCPTCGANLNDTTCECGVSGFELENPFAKLKDILNESPD